MFAHRRNWLKVVGAGLLGSAARRASLAGEDRLESSSPRIIDLRVTPIALPDPPLLLVARRRRYHRGPEAEDRGWPDEGPRWPRTGSDSRPRQAGAGPRGLP